MRVITQLYDLVNKFAILFPRFVPGWERDGKTFLKFLSYAIIKDMNQLDRLEALAQRLIEGAFHRFFQTQPPSTAQMDQKIETKEVLGLATNDMAARWILQVEDHQIRLGEPVVNIGRALDNDIVLSDPTVSRYHAQLRWREGRYHLCPPERSSLAGATPQPSGRTKQTKRLLAHTMINRRAVDRGPLNPNDLLTLGESSLKVILDDVEI